MIPKLGTKRYDKQFYHLFVLLRELDIDVLNFGWLAPSHEGSKCKLGKCRKKLNAVTKVRWFILRVYVFEFFFIKVCSIIQIQTKTNALILCTLTCDRKGSCEIWVPCLRNIIEIWLDEYTLRLKGPFRIAFDRKTIA